MSQSQTTDSQEWLNTLRLLPDLQRNRRQRLHHLVAPSGEIVLAATRIGVVLDWLAERDRHQIRAICHPQALELVFRRLDKLEPWELQLQVALAEQLKG